MNFYYKKKLIDSYRKVRRLNTDIYADTYRGGMYENSYLPYSISYLKKQWGEFLCTDSNKLIDFYLHIPFCPTLCKYCDYYKELINVKKAEYYIDWVISYLKEFIDIFKGVKFRSIYIGGGTPSVLLENQLDKLLDFLFSNFNFSEKGEKTFEINPFTLTTQKWDVISRYPFNRISMGVQTLDPIVLKKMNRGYQTEKILSNAIHLIKSKGNIKYINADLIMGLKYEDDLDKFKYTIKRLGELGFNQIVLYRLLPTEEYLKEHYEGDLYKFYKEFFKKIKNYYFLLKHNKDTILKYYKIIKINLHNGYRWDLLKSDIDYDIYDDFGQWSLFAVGPSARGHIFGKFYYEFPKTLNFLNNVNDYLILGKDTNIDDEISLYTIVSIMRHGYIDKINFYNLFKVDFNEYYKEELNFLRKEGKIIGENSKKMYFYFKFYEKNYYALFFLRLSRLEELNLLNNIKVDGYIKKSYKCFDIFVNRKRKNLVINNKFLKECNLYSFYNLLKIWGILEI